MSKGGNTSRTAARHAGRAGVGLAVVATAVGVGAPAAHAEGSLAVQPMTPLPGVHGASVGGHVVRTDQPTMTYRVVAGDTVSRIAARTGSSVSAIVRANNLGSDALIRAGQMLRIPSAARSGGDEAPSATPASNGSSTTAHTVAAGDTLSAIAARYDTSVDRLVRLNGLDSADVIHVGQRLRVSGDAGGASAAPAAPASTSAPTTADSGSGSTHTVRAGETVSAIAARYDTTVEEIIQANDLGSDALIYVGQRLAVGGSGGQSSAGSSSSDSSDGSSSSGSTISYTVSSGDTVGALASRFGVPAQSIVTANDLGSDALIYVGQRLTIPSSTNLVDDSFLGRRYPEATVASANANKAALLAAGVPSREQMQSMVVQVANEMGVDPALAQAHAYQESGFNHASVSPANAIGTMQVIPTSGEWASDLVGRDLNLLDPYDNVVAGVSIIRALQSTASSTDQGIAAYYQGLGSVREYGMFDDTEDYVRAIKAHMNRF
ncbi:LysM peptidoglycan-binding domain-containing protein [Georgenia alba]|uniref:LysM peptidoglycan-binding domain-containing protein n=1 Tax=Georgenia alba TaxID=2233858 RepID=A0ABW2QA23_9MICO